MSNNIVQQLLRQIEQLERKNEQYRGQISRFERDMEFVIQTTQFQTWEGFMQWIHSQSSTHKSQGSAPQLPKIHEISAEHYTSQDTDINYRSGAQRPEDPDSVSNSDILQQAKLTHEIRSIDLGRTINQSSSKDLKQTISKQQRLSAKDATDLECVVIENSSLRKNVRSLQKQLEIYRLNIVRLAKLLPQNLGIY